MPGVCMCACVYETRGIDRFRYDTFGTKTKLSIPHRAVLREVSEAESGYEFPFFVF